MINTQGSIEFARPLRLRSPGTRAVRRRTARADDSDNGLSIRGVAYSAVPEAGATSSCSLRSTHRVRGAGISAGRSPQS